MSDNFDYTISGSYEGKHIQFKKHYQSGSISDHYGVLNAKGFGGSFNINDHHGHFVIYQSPNIEIVEDKENDLKESPMWNRKTNKLDEIMRNMYQFSQKLSIIEKRFTTYEDMLYLSSYYNLDELGRNVQDIEKSFPFIHHFNEHPKKNTLRRSLYSQLCILRYYYMNQLVEANIEECVYLSNFSF